MANIQERKTSDGKVRFRVQVRLKGYPTQYATFRRKTDAEKWIQQTESSIREGRHFKTAEPKKHTLNELIDRYIKNVAPNKKKHGKKQESHLLWWKAQIGSFLLSDITPALLAEQRDKLLAGTTYRGSKRSSSTVVRYMASLSYAFSVAMKEWGWLDDNPLRKVSKPSEPRGRVRFLDADERNRLLEACKKSQDKYLYLIVVIAISTGMRYSEIINLTWADVDLVKCRIILHQTKNGERRGIYPWGVGQLNYIGPMERSKMLLERPMIEKALEGVFSKIGIITLRIPQKHAGGKWQLKYPSHLGGKANFIPFLR